MSPRAAKWPAQGHTWVMELVVGLYTHALSIISPFILKIEGHGFFVVLFLIPILEIIHICFSLYSQNTQLG